MRRGGTECLQCCVAGDTRKAGFDEAVKESFKSGARSRVERHRRSGIPRPAEISVQSRHSTVVRLKRTRERKVRCNTYTAYHFLKMPQK